MPKPKPLKKVSTSQQQVFYIVGSIIVVLLLISIYHSLNSTAPKTIDVYYIGRGTDTANSANNDVYRFNYINSTALKYYLDEISAQNGIQYNLTKRYNHNNADSSLQIYTNIKKAHPRNEPFIVVDNTWGSDQVKCADFIRKENIPVININADHGNLFKNTSSVFIANDDETPSRMCLFIKEILNCNTINFVGEANFSTTQSYLQRLQQSGIAIKDSAMIPNSNVDSMVLKRIEKMDFWQQPIPLLINTHGFYGKEILKILKRKRATNKVLVPVYAIPLSSLKSEKDYAYEIILLNKTWDGASKYILEDWMHFLKGIDSAYFPRSNTPTFLVRCRRAAEIIHMVSADTALSSNPAFIATTNTIAANLRKLSNNPIRKYGDAFRYEYKDTTQVLKKDYSFKIYKNDLEYFYPKQINDSNQIIPNITFGIKLESIHNINVQAGTFTIDFYYWLKVDSSFKSPKKYISFKNITNKTDEEVLTKQIKGTPIVYTLNKVSGTCTQKLDPFYYPRDSYSLELTGEVLESHNNILISYDGTDLTLDEEKKKEINAEGWRIKDIKYSVDNKSQANKLGLSSGQEERFKSVTIYMNVSRNATYEILFFVIPYFLLALISILVMLIRGRTFELVGDTSIGLVVGTIAYSISIAGYTPSKGNLLMIDYINSATLFIVLLNMGLCVIQSSMFMKPNRKAYITRKIGIALLFLYVIGVIATFLLYSKQP